MEFTDGLLKIFSFFTQWGLIFWTTLCETAPFLIMGLLSAGLLHVFVPIKIILWALGRGGWSGAIRGALLGIPLPLCSCSVVPTSLALRKQGASLSSTTAFTISTPETSVDALAITAAVLPLGFLGIRPVAALILAIVIGVIVEKFSNTIRNQVDQNLFKLSHQQFHREADSYVCKVCGLMTNQNHSHSIVTKVKALIEYSFGKFFNDIATWIIFGLALAALIQILIPDTLFKQGWLVQHPNLQILLMSLIGLPMYSCATGTTPLAAVLLIKGVSPGAVLALLLTGPATNIGTVMIFRKEFGLRYLVIFYSSLLVLCFLMGLALNYAWPILEKIPRMTTIVDSQMFHSTQHRHSSWLEVLSAWLILLLTFKFWISHFRKDDDCCHDSTSHEHH